MFSGSVCTFAAAARPRAQIVLSIFAVILYAEEFA